MTKLFGRVFLIEKSCLNCLTVDRFKDNKKKIKFDVFFCNKRVSKPSLRS